MTEHAMLVNILGVDTEDIGNHSMKDHTPVKTLEIDYGCG